MAAQHEVTVRVATREDMPLIYTMILELAEFEGMPQAPKLTVEDLCSDGFGSEAAWFFALVAERGGAAEGYALCTRAYSSATARAFYLEDLYVRPAARRRGVATRLLRALCKMARAQRVRSVDWHVLEHNAAALALYRRVGARDLRVSEGRAAMRLDAPAVQLLADGGAGDADGGAGDADGGAGDAGAGRS